jgi:hypothetical protein
MREPPALNRDFAPRQQPLADIRFRRQVNQLCRLGDRAVAEAFAEIGARYLIQTPIEQLIERCIR